MWSCVKLVSPFTRNWYYNHVTSLPPIIYYSTCINAKISHAFLKQNHQLNSRPFFTVHRSCFSSQLNVGSRGAAGGLLDPRDLAHLSLRRLLVGSRLCRLPRSSRFRCRVGELSAVGLSRYHVPISFSGGVFVEERRLSQAFFRPASHWRGQKGHFVYADSS